MINSKITTDIMTRTGFTIDIPPAKVVINNQEITDLETFNKVVDSIKEKDKEIERLNNIIKDKEIERLNNIIEEYEKWLEEHSKIDYECSLTIVHEQLALSIALDKLKELKEGKE